MPLIPTSLFWCCPLLVKHKPTWPTTSEFNMSIQYMTIYCRQYFLPEIDVVLPDPHGNTVTLRRNIEPNWKWRPHHQAAMILNLPEARSAFSSKGSRISSQYLSTSKAGDVYRTQHAGTTWGQSAIKSPIKCYALLLTVHIPGMAKPVLWYNKRSYTYDFWNKIITKTHRIFQPFHTHGQRWMNLFLSI